MRIGIALLIVFATAIAPGAHAGGVAVVDCKYTLNGKCAENTTTVEVSSDHVPFYGELCTSIGTGCA